MSGNTSTEMNNVVSTHVATSTTVPDNADASYTEDTFIKTLESDLINFWDMPVTKEDIQEKKTLISLMKNDSPS